jgi:ribosomal protein S17E
MKFRLFYLDYPFKKRRIYLRFPSVLTGDFNHFQTKLCETKPNSEMLKMNITDYMTKDYKKNSEFLSMEKQSQTNPNHTRIKLKNLPAYGGQTQTKPNLPADAGKFALSVIEGPMIIILFRALPAYGGQSQLKSLLTNSSDSLPYRLLVCISVSLLFWEVTNYD